MKLRYERKYLVKKTELDRLRLKLRPFVRPDTFANKGVNPEYTVRSIYFDSPDKSALNDKSEGLQVRRKLRIRGYDDMDSETKVFLEIKRKFGNRIGKNRALVSFDKLADWLEFGPDIEMDDKSTEVDDTLKFFYYLKKEFQSPVNLIVYDREPYHGKFDPTVRVTFDKNIRSKLHPEIHELFRDDDFTHIWKDYFILEIKYNEPPMPSWLKQIVEEFKLQSQALSKYAEGYYCHKYNSN